MKKYLIIFGLELVFLVAIYVMFSNFTERVISSIPQDSNKATNYLNYTTNANMIGSGNDVFSTTPVSAVIKDGVLNISAKIQNRTANTYEIKTFANMDFGGYTYPGNILFPADTNVIEGNQEIDVEFEININNLKFINAIPTEFSVDLGTYTGPNKTYGNYNFKYTIAWGA